MHSCEYLHTEMHTQMREEMPFLICYRCSNEVPTHLSTYLLPFGVAVEVIRPNILTEHNIVIQINKLLRQPLDAMDVTFNSRGAESRQVAQIPENVLEQRRHTQKVNVSRFALVGHSDRGKGGEW